MSVMSNPLSMFDVKGNVALITGASGAFGMVAARVLAGAGCRLVLVAGNQEALDQIAEECRGMGAEVTDRKSTRLNSSHSSVSRMPSSA